MAIGILYPIIPRFVLKRCNPERYGIETLVRMASKQVGQEQLILDAGSGEAQYKPHFRHAHYLATDFMRVGEQTYQGIDIISELHNLPFKENCFDAILCTQVLEHVKYPLQVLKEFRRILKLGGSLFLTVPLGGPGLHQIPYDFHRFTEYTLIELLQDAGFGIESLEPRGGYFWEMGFMFRLLPRIVFPDIFYRRSFASMSFCKKIVFLFKESLFTSVELVFELIVPLICFYLDVLLLSSENVTLTVQRICHPPIDMDLKRSAPGMVWPGFPGSFWL